MKLFLISILTTFLISTASGGCQTLTGLKTPGYTQAVPRIFFDTIPQNFVKKNKEVQLLFLDLFEDSVEVYNKDIKILSFNGKNEQRAFTSINPSNNQKKNEITVACVKSKSFIRFKINGKYPIYTIQKYDDTWYVNGRIKLELK